MGAQDFENHMLAKTMLGLGSRNFESCIHVTIDTWIITKGMPCSSSYANLKTLPSQLKSQRYIDQSNMPPLETRETRLNWNRLQWKPIGNLFPSHFVKEKLDSTWWKYFHEKTVLDFMQVSHPIFLYKMPKPPQKKVGVITSIKGYNLFKWSYNPTFFLLGPTFYRPPQFFLGGGHHEMATTVPLFFVRDTPYYRVLRGGETGNGSLNPPKGCFPLATSAFKRQVAIKPTPT